MCSKARTVTPSGRPVCRLSGGPSEASRIECPSKGLAFTTAEPEQGGPARAGRVSGHLPAELQVSGQLHQVETFSCFSVLSRPKLKQELRFLRDTRAAGGTRDGNVLAGGEACYISGNDCRL